MNETSTSTKQSWLARLLHRRWARWLAVSLAIPTLALAALATYVAAVFMEDEPVAYGDPVEHFKYGSTGGERESGFPYWIFQVMPRVCERQLPGGYASLGMVFEDGKDLPVGMSMRRYQGVDRTFLNCAVCHTSTVRDAPDAKPLVVTGMPANTFNVWGFQKFFFECGKDPKFAAEYVVPEIDRLMRERGKKLGPVDRHVIYPVAVALMRERLIMLSGRFEELLTYPEWGPGRVDTFNAAKVLFNFPLKDLPLHEKNAPSDFPSIWLRSRARKCSCTGRQHQSGGAQPQRRVRDRHDAGHARQRGDQRSSAGSPTSSRRSIRTRSMRRRPRAAGSCTPRTAPRATARAGASLPASSWGG
jgi:hypothetical protein